MTKRMRIVRDTLIIIGVALVLALLWGQLIVTLAGDTGGDNTTAWVASFSGGVVIGIVSVNFWFYYLTTRYYP